MKVSEVMQGRVCVCSHTDPISRCARLMRDEKIGLLPVVNGGGRVVGVVTDRDLALRGLAGDRGPETLVSEVMTYGPVVTASPDDELNEIECRLAKCHKSRALVTDGEGRCVGIVGLEDIAWSETPLRTAILRREVRRRGRRY